MNKKRIYDNYLSNIYAGPERLSKVEHEYFSMYSWNKKYVVPYLPESRKSVVLDVGCGLGQNLFTFSKLGYKDVIGIDISKECVDFCKKRGFKVLKTSVETYLKNKRGKFDVITVYHVVEHIRKERIVALIKLLKRSLKRKGVLVINVPNGASAITGVHDRYVDITHEILYTPESIRELQLLAGFSPGSIIVREEVAYSPSDRNIVKKILKALLLPVLTRLSDLIWYFFFISVGASPRKNRPVLLVLATNS